MHSFQVVLHRNIREIREIRGRYIHAKVVLMIINVEGEKAINVEDIRKSVARAASHRL